MPRFVQEHLLTLWPNICECHIFNIQISTSSQTRDIKTSLKQPITTTEACNERLKLSKLKLKRTTIAPLVVYVKSSQVDVNK